MYFKTEDDFVGVISEDGKLIPHNIEKGTKTELGNAPHTLSIVVSSNVSKLRSGFLGDRHYWHHCCSLMGCASYCR